MVNRGKPLRHYFFGLGPGQFRTRFLVSKMLAWDWFGADVVVEESVRRSRTLKNTISGFRLSDLQSDATAIQKDQEYQHNNHNYNRG